MSHPKKGDRYRLPSNRLIEIRAVKGDALQAGYLHFASMLPERGGLIELTAEFVRKYGAKLPKARE